MFYCASPSQQFDLSRKLFWVRKLENAENVRKNLCDQITLNDRHRPSRLLGWPPPAGCAVLIRRTVRQVARQGSHRAVFQ